MENESTFELWELLAGMGVFLFGMFLLEEAVKNLSGKAFKQLIKKYTENRFKAFFTGALATGILQSSSAVSLMILAFVGAGVMQMQNAIGVIIGSNVGTTLTSWIVALVGFKLNIEELSFPLLGIGGLGLIFFGKGKASNVSRLLVGFGFLFLGLSYMKSSMEAFTQNFDLAQFPLTSTYSFIFIGFVLTALVQSSSAAIAITLSALYSGFISFELAAAMVIGSNLGTTVTILIGSVGGDTNKKRVAIAHFIFNFITALVAALLINVLITSVNVFIDIEKESVTALALFHTFFNVLGVIIFLPFTKKLAEITYKVFPEKIPTAVRFISNVTEHIPDASISAMQMETKNLIRKVLSYNMSIFSIDASLVLSVKPNMPIKQYKELEELSEQYDEIKLIQSELFAFASAIQKEALSEEESAQLNALLYAVRFAAATAKTIKDVSKDVYELESTENDFIKSFYSNTRKNLMSIYMQIDEAMFQEDNEINLPKLVSLLKNIRNADEQNLNEITSNIKTQNLNNKQLSLLIGVNRSVALSSRQVVLATKDLLLNKHDAKVFENFDSEII
jgi:phosphate:Na+ symporter